MACLEVELLELGLGLSELGERHKQESKFRESCQMDKFVTL